MDNVVFHPSRRLLEENVLCLETCRPHCSQQTWRLRLKVLKVDDVNDQKPRYSNKQVNREMDVTSEFCWRFQNDMLGLKHIETMIGSNPRCGSGYI